MFETEKPAYRRNQFGGSVGGPLLRDRIHYFGAVERTKIDEFYTVFTGLPQFYSALEGTFAKPFTRNLYLARVDGQVSNTQSFFARYAQEDENSTCNGCGGTISSTAGFDQETPRRAVVVGHTWVRGTRQLNDFRFQYARAAYYISPAGTEVWTDISDNSAERLARLTRQLQFPALTYGSSNDQIGPESRWQFKDTYAITLPTHDLKFGVDISHMPYQYESTGNPLGTYSFTRDQYFDPNDPASIAALTGAATFTASVPPVTTSHPNSYYVAFVQDDWRLRDNVTLNLGPALRAAVRSGQRRPRPVGLPRADPLHRRRRARRHQQPGPARGRRLGRGRRRPHRRARRLRPLLRPRPHPRQPQRVQELPAVQRQHHQSVVSRPLRRPRSALVHRHRAGQHHRGRQRLRAALFESIQRRASRSRSSASTACTSTR